MSAVLDLSNDDAEEMDVGPGTAPWGYSELLVFAAIGLLCQYGTVWVAVRLLGGEGPEAAEELLSQAHVVVPLQIAAWIPVLAYIAYVVSGRWGVPLRTGLGWLPMRGKPARYVRLGVLLACCSLLASIAIGRSDGPTPMEELLSDLESLWPVAVFGVFVAPWVEELVFRGFLFGPLERIHGRAFAVIATSAIFAGLHGGQYGWHTPKIALLAAIGLVLGIVRSHSGSTVASTIVHMFYNGALVVFLAFSLGVLG